MNVDNMNRTETDGGFFKGESYTDVYYLSSLCADAAPVLAMWTASGDLQERCKTSYISRINAQNDRYDGVLQFNVSRYVAKIQMEKAGN